MRAAWRCRRAQRGVQAVRVIGRALDAGDGHLLLVERPPQAAEWEAINDRLRRAAVGAAPGDDSP